MVEVERDFVVVVELRPMVLELPIAPTEVVLETPDDDVLVIFTR